MSGEKLRKLVEEERTLVGPPPPDWPASRRMRHAMFNGGTTVDAWAGTGLYVTIKGLRDLGFTVVKDGRTYHASAARRGRPPKPKPERTPRKQPLLKRKVEPAPATPPPLGANVVVFALLAHEGDVVVGFAERDGRQWFAVLTEPPS
jgi:hypothetical protein